MSMLRNAPYGRKKGARVSRHSRLVSETKTLAHGRTKAEVWQERLPKTLV